MSYDFTRNIPNIRKISDQPFNTNVQNDDLSETSGELYKRTFRDDTKKPMYFCLTDVVKSINGEHYPANKEGNNDLIYRPRWSDEVIQKPFGTLNFDEFLVSGKEENSNSGELQLNREKIDAKVGYLQTDNITYAINDDGSITFQIPTNSKIFDGYKRLLITTNTTKILTLSNDHYGANIFYNKSTQDFTITKNMLTSTNEYFIGTFYEEHAKARLFLNGLGVFRQEFYEPVTWSSISSKPFITISPTDFTVSSSGVLSVNFPAQDNVIADTRLENLAYENELHDHKNVSSISQCFTFTKNGAFENVELSNMFSNIDKIWIDDTSSYVEYNTSVTGESMIESINSNTVYGYRRIYLIKSEAKQSISVMVDMTDNYNRYGTDQEAHVRIKFTEK